MGHRLYATFKKLKQIVSLAREEFFRERISFKPLRELSNTI